MFTNFSSNFEQLLIVLISIKLNPIEAELFCMLFFPHPSLQQIKIDFLMFKKTNFVKFHLDLFIVI